jgi:hypothetical protein
LVTKKEYFEEISDPEARAVTKRDAYERVQYLLKGLGTARVVLMTDH